MSFFVFFSVELLGGFWFSMVVIVWICFFVCSWWILVFVCCFFFFLYIKKCLLVCVVIWGECVMIIIWWWEFRLCRICFIFKVILLEMLELILLKIKVGKVIVFVINDLVIKVRCESLLLEVMFLMGLGLLLWLVEKRNCILLRFVLLSFVSGLKFIFKIVVGMVKLVRVCVICLVKFGVIFCWKWLIMVVCLCSCFLVLFIWWVSCLIFLLIFLYLFILVWSCFWILSNFVLLFIWCFFCRWYNWLRWVCSFWICLGLKLVVLVCCFKVLLILLSFLVSFSSCCCSFFILVFIFVVGWSDCVSIWSWLMIDCLFLYKNWKVLVVVCLVFLVWFRFENLCFNIFCLLGRSMVFFNLLSWKCLNFSFWLVVVFCCCKCFNWWWFFW